MSDPHLSDPLMSDPLLPLELTETGGLSGLPLAQQTAWQRWEMASFGDNRPTAVAHAAAEKAARAAITAQLSQQIASSRERARIEGHAEGLAAGRAEGHAQGLEEGRLHAEAERVTLQQLADSFTDALASANELIAQDLLSLALDIAKAMLKTALEIKPELVLPAVHDALHYLPSMQTPAILALHPKDAAIVRTQMGGLLEGDGWQIIEDAQMPAGGCRIETSRNQIDATTPTRWQRIASTLGSDSQWLQD